MKKGGFLGFGESSPTDSGSGSSMFGSIGDTLSGWGSSISDTASSAYNKTKNAVTGSTSSSYVSPPPATYPPPATSSSGYMGGRMSRRKRSRKMRGGYSDNIALTGLAARAAPISDIKSAQPLTTVGGRRTKRRHGGKHRHGKSCKRCKY
jgi:hypothetical protein